MAIKTDATIVGNVGNIYELRRVGKDNRAVIEFTVASTPRVRKDNGDWTDGEPTWTTVVAWNKLAENIEKTFEKGSRVVVVGHLNTKPEFTKDDGTVIPAKLQLIADFAGLEISFDPAHSERESKNSKSAPTTRKKTVSTNKSAPQKKAPVEDLDLDDDDLLDDDEDLAF